LLARAQSGDADSFCILCRACETRLLRQATQLCGDASLAEDLAQETLFAAWKSIRRFNGQCQFFTWLCAILLNRYRNVRRQRLPLTWSGLSAADRDGAWRRFENVADFSPSPEEMTATAEQMLFVRRCLNDLPAKHREVIYLRFFVEDSLEAIAAALSCSVGTVKSRLFHALEKLRRMNHARLAREEIEGSTSTED
jgi:RNA polymerase sigma-70 factor (ECF subfamily)